MMFGIGKRDSRLSSPTVFVNLLGADQHSYGLSHKGTIHHNKTIAKYCEPFEERQSAVVGVLFNGPKRELSYFVNGTYMGVAFEDFDLKDAYYPMISSTSQRSCFNVREQKYRMFVMPLAELCLNRVTSLLKRRSPNLEVVDHLGLPHKLARTVKQHVYVPEAAPKKRQRLAVELSESMEIDSEELDPDLVVQLSQNIREQLIKLAWSQSSQL